MRRKPSAYSMPTFSPTSCARWRIRCSSASVGPPAPNWLTWQAAAKTRVSGALSYTGGQRYDNDQANAYSRTMPAYTVADVKLVHQTGGWILSAIAANLFDKRYFSYGIVESFACATPACMYPQPGRTLFASAEYRFR